jgi:hypothetical protein
MQNIVSGSSVKMLEFYVDNTRSVKQLRKPEIEFVLYLGLSGINICKSINKVAVFEVYTAVLLKLSSSGTLRCVKW